MNWNFKDIAQASALSQAPFRSGEQVVCLIYKDAESDKIARADVRVDEMKYFEVSGELLGRWVRVVQDSSEARATVHEKIASAEDFFFSLYKSEPTGAQEETDALKYLLVLMLERKRVVRVSGKRQLAGKQKYTHVKTKQELNVPIVEFSADLLSKIQHVIGEIIL